MSIEYEHASVNSSLSERFLTVLERHVAQLKIRGPKASGLCPFHDDRKPSFSADIAKGIWYCFPCGIGGGVKKFIELIGEEWTPQRLPRSKQRRAVILTTKRWQAERQARAILRKREEERLDALFDQWRDVNEEADHAAELLALFTRRPDLEVEFSDLATQTARNYGAAIHRRVWLEAAMDGEVEA